MRLERLAERMGDIVAIDWKAFLLRTEPKTRDQEQFVEYTRSWLRPAEMEPAADFRVWATDDPAPSSSVPPHMAAKAVHTIAPEADRAFHHRLLSAYFTENRTISEWDVLFELAGDVGVSPHELGATVHDRHDVLLKTVIEEHDEAVENGINAVPTVVIAGVLPVPGAQEVDTYETWIRRIIEHQEGAGEG